MVIVDPSRGWTSFGGEVIPFVSEAADAEGESPVWYSVLVYDAERLRDRLEMAREVLASGHLEGAVSAAYYAMLYAARATPSESPGSREGRAEIVERMLAA